MSSILECKNSHLLSKRERISSQVENFDDLILGTCFILYVLHPLYQPSTFPKTRYDKDKDMHKTKDAHTRTLTMTNVFAQERIILVADFVPRKRKRENRAFLRLSVENHKRLLKKNQFIFFLFS